MSRELAIQACRIHLGLAQSKLESPLETEVPSVLMALEGEGLHGLVADLWLPHTDSLAVRQAAGFCRLRHERVERELSLLAAASPCDFLVLKGAALGSYLYRPGQRDCRDIDLLVDPGGRTAFEAALRDRGYLPDPAAGHSFLRGSLQVDLHEHPLGLAERLFPMALPDFWEHSLPLQGRLRRLTDEFEFLVGLIHEAKHGFGRLVWLLDSALLLQGMEPGRVQELVQRYGLSRLLDYALWAMLDLFQMEPPKGLEAALKPWAQRGWLEKWLLSKIGLRRGTDRLGRLLLALACTKSGARWWLLRSLLWPPGMGWAEQFRRLPRLLQLWIQGEL